MVRFADIAEADLVVGFCLFKEGNEGNLKCDKRNTHQHEN